MPSAICKPTIVLGGCCLPSSRIGKPYLLTYIAGSDKEYGQAFVKISVLPKSNGIEQTLETATTQNCPVAKFTYFLLEQMGVLPKYLMVN